MEKIKKNRFYDLCPEGITLHLRFPYSVVCALFCFPTSANADDVGSRAMSTFKRAQKLLATISGREEYTDPGEKFENITMLLFEPLSGDSALPPNVRLFDTVTGREMGETEYFEMIRQVFNRRNPHSAIGDDIIEVDSPDD